MVKKNIQVFCEPEQYQVIISNANKLGLPPSTYLRMLALERNDDKIKAAIKKSIENWSKDILITEGKDIKENT